MFSFLYANWFLITVSGILTYEPTFRGHHLFLREFWKSLIGLRFVEESDDLYEKDDVLERIGKKGILDIGSFEKHCIIENNETFIVFFRIKTIQFLINKVYEASFRQNTISKLDQKFILSFLSERKKNSFSFLFDFIFSVYFLCLIIISHFLTKYHHKIVFKKGIPKKHRNKNIVIRKPRIKNKNVGESLTQNSLNI